MCTITSICRSWWQARGRQGRGRGIFVSAEPTPLANLHLSCSTGGVKLDCFADSTGKVAELIRTSGL